MFRRRRHDQNANWNLLAFASPRAAEHAFSILPQDLEVFRPVGARLKGWAHSPDPAAPRFHFVTRLRTVDVVPTTFVSAPPNVVGAKTGPLGV